MTPRAPICATCGNALAYEIGLPNGALSPRPVLLPGEGEYFWFNPNRMIGSYDYAFDDRDIPYCRSCVEVYDALEALRK